MSWPVKIWRKMEEPYTISKKKNQTDDGNYLNLSYLFYTLLQADSHTLYVFQIVTFPLFVLHCNESLRKKMPIWKIQCCTCQ